MTTDTNSERTAGEDVNFARCWCACRLDEDKPHLWSTYLGTDAHHDNDAPAILACPRAFPFSRSKFPMYGRWAVAQRVNPEAYLGLLLKYGDIRP